MPTYDYVCDACKHEFEEYQSITAVPLKKCPKCGKSKLKRLMGAGGGIIFKGGGFYQTDYRSDSYKKSAEADTKASSPAPAADAAKSSDAKTPAKADAAASTAPKKSDTTSSPTKSSGSSRSRKSKSD